MEKFIITREMLKKANTYMPIGTKADVAATIAKNVLCEAPTAAQNKEGEKILALPYLKTESYANMRCHPEACIPLSARQSDSRRFFSVFFPHPRV